MFVSNHNSWMDIPFLGHAIGWHNYKFIAKKELEKVPILGKAIKCGKNVLVDRTDRKSQLMTLKQGIKWLDVSFCHRPSVRPSVRTVGRTVSKMRAPNFVLSFDLLCFIHMCRRYENRTYRVILLFRLPDRGAAARPIIATSPIIGIGIGNFFVIVVVVVVLVVVVIIAR